jgi:hypothetical protein
LRSWISTKQLRVNSGKKELIAEAFVSPISSASEGHHFPQKILLQ